MATTIKKKENLYWVDCFTEGGFCYASHDGCTWEDVQCLRRIAKILGETVKYEKSGFKEYSYTV